MPEAQMSEDAARKEFEEIQAEIAKEKGNAPEKEEEEEPIEPEEPEGDEPEDDLEPEVEAVIEPLQRTAKDHNKIPLSKYQETKKDLEAKVQAEQAEKETYKKQAETLAEELRLAKTSSSMAEKVKAFSEKTGMDEQAAMDLVQLAIEAQKPTKDPQNDQNNQKVAVFLKKQEAEENFQNELDAFIEENPDAADFEDKIRAHAFKKENLDKSLYEIFHKNVKTDTVVKKKTGEAGRGTARQTVPGFDVTKVIEGINSGKNSPLKGLTETQIDEVFAAMEKSGSRYNR